MTLLPAAKVFFQIVEDYSKHYPYLVYQEIRESRMTREGSDSPLERIYLKQPMKLNWCAAELLAFEGAEFAEAVSQLLRGRAATATERLHFEGDSLPWTRIAFILKLDQENRNDGSPVRVRKLSWCRHVWRAERFFSRKRLNWLAKLSLRLFRKSSLWLVYAILGETSMRQLVHMSLIEIDALSNKPALR